MNAKQRIIAATCRVQVAIQYNKWQYMSNIHKYT